MFSEHKINYDRCQCTNRENYKLKYYSLCMDGFSLNNVVLSDWDIWDCEKVPPA